MPRYLLKLDNNGDIVEMEPSDNGNPDDIPSGIGENWIPQTVDHFEAGTRLRGTTWVDRNRFIIGTARTGLPEMRNLRTVGLILLDDARYEDHPNSEPETLGIDVRTARVHPDGGAR